MSEGNASLDDVEAWSKKMSMLVDHGARDVIERMPVNIPADKLIHVHAVIRRHLAAAIMELGDVFPPSKRGE